MKKIFFLALSLCVYNINIYTEIYTYTVMEEDEKQNEIIFLYDKDKNECTVIPIAQHDDLKDLDTLVQLYSKNIRDANQSDRAFLENLIKKVEYFSKPLEERIPGLIEYFDAESKKILTDRELFFNEEKNEIWTLIYYKNDLGSGFLLRKADAKERNVFIRITAVKKVLIQKELNKKSLN